MLTPEETLRILRAMPCGSRLLSIAGDAQDIWIVGGAVRDLLLGREPSELDVVTLRPAAEVAALLGEVTSTHERFGTAMARWGDCVYDVATIRTESYFQPGALPDVAEGGSLEQDLRRRDFTINAIAMAPTGELIAADHALSDLRDGIVRVLHDRSFLDDPTRLWRLVRYSVRLGFGIEPRTRELAAQAVAGGALETVSGDRLGAELRLALTEPDPLGTLHAATNLGLIGGLRLDPSFTARTLSLLAPEGRADLAILGSCLQDAAVVDSLGFTAADLGVLRRCVLIEPLREEPPSAIAARLRGEPVEAVAVAGARGSSRMAELWLLQWRHVRLEIDGDDLLAAGVPEGPEIGRRLDRVLALKLDGELSGRDAELAAALS